MRFLYRRVLPAFMSVINLGMHAAADLDDAAKEQNDIRHPSPRYLQRQVLTQPIRCTCGPRSYCMRLTGGERVKFFRSMSVVAGLSTAWCFQLFVQLLRAQFSVSSG